MTELCKIEECNEENIKLLDRYNLIIKNKGLTEKSIVAINIDLKLFMRFLKDKYFNDTTHRDVEDFLFYCQGERKNTSPTLGRKFTSLNSFYNTMLKKEYLSCVNPLFKMDKIKIRKKLRNHLTKEEYDKIISFLEETNNLRGLAIFSLLFSSGIRLSELHQLNISSIDFELKRFPVLGKGDKPRICIFSDEAKKHIQSYLESRSDNYECLFLSRQNNKLSAKAIQDFVKSTGKKAGITQNVHPHLLRHGTAMWLLENDVPLDRIQIVLGHSSVQTTQHYAHNSMDTVQSIVEDVYGKNNPNKK